MSQDSEGIKTIEQWRWSEMQGLELLPDAADPFKTNPAANPATPTNASATTSTPQRAERMESSEPKKDSTGGGEKPESLPAYALYFLVVGAAVWAGSWAEISCWMWTGERQSTKMRIKYLEAALSQDIQYFDTEVRTSDVVFAINTDTVMVQDAISEKLGNFIHYMATFVSGFVVGFTAVWQLALVTLAVVPLIAVIGGIHTTALGKISGKSQEALSQAGHTVEQTVAQIRVVLSYVGESRALQAYSSALKVAQKLGYKSGFAKGMGLGATYFVVFCCYALLLWYGGYLVRHHFTNGGLAIATMFAVMLGGIPGMDRNSEAGVELESVTGLVELKNVDFSYPSRQDVRILNNFSLNVPAGKTIALWCGNPYMII
ncbi:ABC transporter B family member 1-like [Pyrus ussuriensis x Pyrus communis]|uniref:ABC transporter B family member 1-like n=1 Tax=Pyrus ussuriensis x Pyrus communis TaxID=2448454 RepID=A0A5N5H8A4_9ROSA|nr:ABC transporter B family member 1-like [Pyrus ussuriensis x Pyrus communis]